MLSRRQFLTTLALSAVGGCRSITGVRSFEVSSVPPRACCWVDSLKPQTIAVVGDVQRTGLFELISLGRTQNDREREAVLRAIAKEKPDMLLMLGDQVVLGDDHAGWSYFDRIMTPIHDADIPVLAMLGNHDYEGVDDSECIRNFCHRFPHQRSLIHGHTRLGGVALLTLDSNFDRLTSSELQRQLRDYQAWLDKLDADPEVKGVIVASHHPPYTNSDLNGIKELRMVADLFAKPFLNARKTRLYLSGHIHAYERFISEDKMFIVSGGGGGPQRDINIKPDRPHKNDAYRKGVVRPFHYMLLSIKDDKITAEVKMLRSVGLREEAKFYVGDRYAVELMGEGKS